MDNHIPVLLNEVLSGLNVKPNGNYIDLTLGRAGHSSRILAKLTSGHLYGFDQDDEAINQSNLILKKIGNNYTLYHLNFCQLLNEMEKIDMVGKIDGILMDLGVSSPQFDNGLRGFSYNYDAPLDMRMDRRNEKTAQTIINTYSEENLIKVFKEYGDERYANSIARNIVKQRNISPIETTFQLVEIVKKSKPGKELRKEGHPAKQVFQALRIEVNDEINVLRSALSQAIKVLNNNGRLAVITFHSGEDRIVKQLFKELSSVEGDRISGPSTNKKIDFSLVTHKPIVPTEEELSINNRAHSAKLRIIEKK